MSDIIKLCERKLFLYHDPEITSLVQEFYIAFLKSLTVAHKIFLKSSKPKTALEESMSRIRQLSQSVQREVDYRHRLKMREASNRLVEMQVEQRQILMAVEDQKRMLQGLQEERNIMSLVQEQQKIMQIVQDIHKRMQNSNS